MAKRSPVFLLDVSTVLALVDAAHVFHQPVFEWFQDHGIHGWATCPLVENGFVRIISQASYPNVNFSVRSATERLKLLVNQAGTHHPWSDDLHLFDETIFDPAEIGSHRRLTDAYLLALAVHHQGCFVTLDTRMTLKGVIGASSASLLVLST